MASAISYGSVLRSAPTPRRRTSRLMATALSGRVIVVAQQQQHAQPLPVDRRQLLALVTAFGGAAAVAPLPLPALADEPRKVVVVGATGATGQRVVKELASMSTVQTIAGVRSFDKARKLGLEAGGVTLAKTDVTSETSVLAEALSGADVVVCATGFVPGNPFKWRQQAHEVDNLGTINLVEAAKAAGVKKFVLLTAILTNGRAWGQADSSGFKVTNAFGGVLDEKLEAEKYLRASGLDYTIVRPGGLEDEATGELGFSPEDTLSTGTVSRSLVAKVMAQAAVSSASSNKVVEVVETGTCGELHTEGACPASLVVAPSDTASWEF